MNVEDLTKDIFAALGSHLQTTLSLPVFFENSDRDAAIKKATLEFVEVRVDGPNIDEVSCGSYDIEVPVDLLLCIEKTSNVLRPRTLMGECAQALNVPIPVISNSLTLGCLQTIGLSGKRSKIDQDYYGTPDKSKTQIQASVRTTLFLYF